MEVRRIPRIIDLSTPAREARTSPKAKARPLHEALPLPPPMPGKASSGNKAPEGSEDASAGIEYSPRLPPDWQPLEYELLEYADVLPAGFVDRIGRELEAQHQRVALLRRLNTLMLSTIRAESTAAQLAAGSLQEVPKLQAQETSGPSILMPCNNIQEEVRRRLEISQTSRQLEQTVSEVRRSSQKELQELATRVSLLEEKSKKQSKEAAVDDSINRKRLWEVEAKVLRYRNRISQLESARRNAERKALTREAEERQQQAEVEQLEAEVMAYRRKVPEFEEIERREEELRRKLRSLKSEQRSATTREKAAAAKAAIESAWQTQVSPRSPCSPTRVPTPLRLRWNA
mmetsp:Transcript_37449/g.67703  ORF Transcript_37449/g.67703 Transcript_37449/m.67703 type:complete len:345 (+) Transcript_37449:58-1092(+)